MYAVPAKATEELLRVAGENGHAGGRIVIALRSEPKTLNPLTAADGTSREVISTMQADLVHINRATQLTEPALAKSWKISADGLRYTLTLRRGLKFSDGHPVDIEDVLFTFRVYLDEFFALRAHAFKQQAQPVEILDCLARQLLTRNIDAKTAIAPDVCSRAIDCLSGQREIRSH